MPKLNDEDIKNLLSRRHPEWVEFHRSWKWLQDSLEGGHRYKTADYGRQGMAPERNLFRHSRETPPPNQPQQIQGAGDRVAYPNSALLEAAANSTYDTRLARTPVPSFFQEIVYKYVSRIYSKEIQREGPDAVEMWWSDIDGMGTDIADWMSDTVAPLLIALGQLDIVVQPPEAPPGVNVRTRADEKAAGLDRVNASIILPDNLVWWEKDRQDRYVQALIEEWWEQPDCKSRKVYRWWNREDCCLFDGQSLEPIGEPVPHPYGRPPICRIYDRKKFRCRNVGQARLEGVAERMRDYYNRDSELIVNDTLQSCPPLSGPVDFLKGMNEVLVGPGHILPKFQGGKRAIGGKGNGFERRAY